MANAVMCENGRLVEVSRNVCRVGDEQTGYDGSRKLRRRKRHLLMDTEGLVLSLYPQRKLPQPGWPEAATGLSAHSGSGLKHLWLDASYEGRGKQWVKKVLGLSVAIVRKPKKPIPQEVARTWRKRGPSRARGWIGRS
jgi:putative transposase